MKCRAIIVDDERVARDRLRRLLRVHPEIEVVAECADGETAITAVREHHPDLLLLDIEMPGLKGFDVLEALGPEREPQVIFVTAYDEYAVRAFEACALDYLLKPTSPERLAKALARALEQIAIREKSAGDLMAPNAPTEQRRFTVRSGGRIAFVAPEEIDWVEAAGNYAILHVGKQNHMVRETMSGMEAQLPAETFLRGSRSAILNLRRVRELYSSSVGDNAAILTDGQKVHVTRSLREIADRLKALE
jgi:two-component system LytT family response regulator